MLNTTHYLPYAQNYSNILIRLFRGLDLQLCKVVLTNNLSIHKSISFYGDADSDNVIFARIEF